MFPWPKRRRSIGEIDGEVRKAIRACVTGQSPWPLLFAGSVGTGKTMAALCLADYCQSPEYFTASGLCEALNRAKFHGGLCFQHEGRAVTWFASDVWRIIGESSLVVLDELGCREKVSDAQYEAVKEVIDAREDKPFVAISNLELMSLAAIYDSRIVSRLAQGTVVSMNGKDRRLS